MVKVGFSPALPIFTEMTGLLSSPVWPLGAGVISSKKGSSTMVTVFSPV